ncbi:MAG: hypothetical protein Q8O07_09795, partial [Chloroflexota bacterium]|nr:hypothetical protein [Chloroflexota bacterium]
AGAHLPDPDALIWEHPIPLLTNPFMLWDLGRVLFFSLLIMEGMTLLVSFFFTDEAGLLPLEILLLVAAIMAGLFAFVSLIVFRNGVHTRFTVDSRGVEMETIFGDDLYERTVNRAVGALVFIANPLLALTTSVRSAASSSTVLDWHEVRKVTVHRRLGVVSLADSWHTVARLYCDPRSVDVLAARVQAHVVPAAARRTRRDSEELPRRRLGFYLAWTAVTAAAFVCSMAWYWAADDMVRPATAAAAFVLLVGWSIPAWWTRLLVWPAAAASLLTLAKLVPPALEKHTILPWYFSYGFQSDTPEFLLALAGSSALVLMSLYVLITRPELPKPGSR